LESISPCEEIASLQEGIFIGTKGEKAQITFKDRNNKERSSFALTNGVPSFERFDETGKSEGDILRKP
jgi:hypothetical protein